MVKKRAYPKIALKYFKNHALHFTEYSVFTLRFSKFENLLDDNSIVSKLLPYIENQQIKRLLIFKEGTLKNKNIHFHVRLETLHFKNKQKLHRSLMDTTFKELKGNKQKQCHECKIGPKQIDQYLGASKTYCAKDGNLIYQSGYTDYQIIEMIKIGNIIKQCATAPIYKKIILFYSLQGLVPEHVHPTRNHWNSIITSIQLYYTEEEKGYVHNTTIFRNLAMNIMKEISYRYRIKQLTELIDYLDYNVNNRVS